MNKWIKNVKINIFNAQGALESDSCILLEKENYKVFSCYNGADSIKIAEKEKLDLIILDVMMPGMDGIQVCEKLRSKNNNKNINKIIKIGNDVLEKNLLYVNKYLISMLTF